jgi:hypothetical protein
MADDINNVKFIEIYEKMPVPTETGVEQKIQDFEKEQEEKSD